jgi:hypothetical protein
MSSVKGMKRWQGKCSQCGRVITGGIVRDGSGINAGEIKLLKHRTKRQGNVWCIGSGSIVRCADLKCTVGECAGERKTLWRHYRDQEAAALLPGSDR